MSIEDKIQSDIKDAMKAREADKLSTLRMLKAAIDNLKISKKTEDLSDEEILQVIQKQVKQRRESAESFEGAGRTEMAKKERDELAILEAYLPAQMSDDELKAIVEAAVKEANASTKADAGNVMKLVMPKVKGKADGKRVNQTVMSLLS